MSLISWIKNLFNKFVKIAKEFIEAALPVAAQLIIGELKDLALAIVQDLNTTDLNNEAKREEALKRLKKEAVNRGILLRDSLASVIIELSVVYFKRW